MAKDGKDGPPGGERDAERRLAEELDRVLGAARDGRAPTVAVPGGSARPKRALALLTCMDARIDPVALFGLDPGDAHILRNAGARVTEDVLRSLALSVNVLGVDTLGIVEHTGCGLLDTSDEELRRLTGAPFDFLPIARHERALEDDVTAVCASSFLARLRAVGGYLYDVESGTVTEHVRVLRPERR